MSSTRREFFGYLGAFSVVAITNPLKAIPIESAAVAPPAAALPASTGFDYAAELGRITDPLPDMLGWSTWTPDEAAALRRQELGKALELVPGDVVTAELPGIKDRVFELEVLEVRGYSVRHRLYEVPR